MKSVKLLTLGLILISLASCQREFLFGCLDPEGNVETRELDFGSFDQLSVSVSSTVTLVQSTQNSVTITAAANVLDRIDEDSEKSGSSLSLEINGCTRLNNNEVTIVVEMIEIKQLSISGDAVLENEGILTNMDDLVLSISGDGDMKLVLDEVDQMVSSISGDGQIEIEGIAREHDIKVSGDGQVDAEKLTTNDISIRTSGDATVYAFAVDEVIIETSGKSFIEVSGTAVEQEISMSGDGEVKNLDLITEKTTVDLSGDCKCEVYVNQELDIKISGDGEVCYKGNPVITSDISGDGKINNCN